MDFRFWFGRLRRAALGLVALALAACQMSDLPKHLTPVPGMLIARMRALGVEVESPIYVRIFKEESEIEVWKQRPDGRYVLFTTYEICRWSGELGPKVVEGDWQAPEGFYTVTPAQMNPNSIAYLAFNIGYPNAFDRSLGRTGSNLMVHGACSSSGCYALTDEDAGEVFSIAREAFEGGQRSFEVHAFPFHMTAQNMARHSNSPHMDFWWMLKEGYDHFDVTRTVPSVNVCDRRYVFNADSGGARFSATQVCPPYTVFEPVRVAVARRAAADRLTYQTLVARLGGNASQPPPAAIASVPATLVPVPGPVPAVVAPPAATAVAYAGPAPAPAIDPATTAAVPEAMTPTLPLGPAVGFPLPRPRPPYQAIATSTSPAPAAVPAPAPAPPANSVPSDLYRGLFEAGPVWETQPATIRPAG